MKKNNASRPEPELIEQIGDLCKFRWPDTGEEYYAMVVFDVHDYGDGPDHRLAYVIDRERSWAEQIAALRSVFESIRSLPVSHLKRESDEHGRIELGRYRHYPARELLRRATEAGLTVEAVDVPDSEGQYDGSGSDF